MPFCKWQSRLADDSRPSSAEVKNVWGCTSSPPHAFMVYRDKTASTFTCCFIHRYDTWSHALEYTLRKFLKHERQKRIIRSFTTALFALYHYGSVIKSVRIWLAAHVERTGEMLNSYNNLTARREKMRPDGRSSVCGISKEFWGADWMHLDQNMVQWCDTVGMTMKRQAE